jgi:hypothetical protein
MAVATADSGELRVDPSSMESPEAPSNLTSAVVDQGYTPPTTQEIPPMADDYSAMTAAPEAQPSASPDNTQADFESPDVARYQREQTGIINPQQYHDMRAFMSEGAFSSPIGLELREARRKLDNGEEADGLLIVDVAKGSPAADAGLHAYKHTTHNVMTGVALAASMVFPPAILAVPLIDYAQVGESYDMIIGVDGTRVTNFLDFEDRMHYVRPGEIVYLSVVRDGKREQIKVLVPPSSTLAW